MKTGILWDLDGTLLDTLEDLVDAVNHTMGCFGYPQRTVSEVRRFVGNGAGRLIALSVPANGDAEGALAVFREYYDAHCREKTKPYEGILSALSMLGQKYPMAVVSNKPDSAVKELCEVFFPGICALGESEACPRKPAPDMLYKAMKDIGAERCVYVGDSEVDVWTARNAGMPCLSVLWGFRDREELEQAGAVHLCETVDELTEKIEEIING